MRLVLSIAALALAGCATPEILTASENGVSVLYPQGMRTTNAAAVRDATGTAQTHCQQFGKTAMMETTPDKPGPGVYIFRCE